MKEKDNVVTSVQINQRQESHGDERASENDNFKQFQSIGSITKTYDVKRDDVVSDSGNSTARDSKIIQSSMATNSFSATKSKMIELTQRFPLNKFPNETKLLTTNSTESDGGVFDFKSDNVKPKPKPVNNSNAEKQVSVDETLIEVIIEKHFDSIKSKLEDTIKTKENTLR